MSLFKYIPTCSKCKYANYYLNWWEYRFENPRCSITKNKITEGNSCSNYWNIHDLPEIRFHHDEFSKIKNGIKKQTLRDHDKHLKPLEVVYAVSTSTGEKQKIKIQYCFITKVDKIRKFDAIKEGFNNRSELINKLFDIYPNLTDNSVLYGYIFKLI